MQTPSITRSRDGGFERIDVDTGAMSFALLPELGGKIAGLQDTRSGREWLWRHPRMPYRRVAHDSSYVEAADSGGWDECFPTVAPCVYPAPPWQDRALPDHGELWSQPVGLEIRTTGEQLVLDAAWQGRALPYTLRRRIIATAGSARLRCEYTLESYAAAPLRWIWCAHALLAVEPGMRLQVPDEARFNVWTALPQNLVRLGEQLRFPFELRSGARSFKLDVLPAGPGALPGRPERSAGVALKVWSDPLSAAWAALVAPDGALRMRWGGAQWSQLALWFNLGAWAGDGGAPYYNLGLEPCIGAQDSLADAVNNGQLAATLPPGGSQSWWIEVELIS